MLEGERNYLEVRVCPGHWPPGDAPLSPLSFVSMDASGKVAIKAWLLLVLDLILGAEHHFCRPFLWGAVGHGNESPLG